MTYRHYNLAVDASLPFDSGTQRYIFLESCYRADSGGVVRYSQTELASLLMLSFRTVAREFGRLQELGLLEKEAHGRYKVVIPATKQPVKDAIPAPISHSTPKVEEEYSPLKEWIILEYGTKTFEKGEIAVKVEQDAYNQEILPDIVREGIAQGELHKVGETKMTTDGFYNIYQFDPSSV